MSRKSRKSSKGLRAVSFGASAVKPQRGPAVLDRGQASCALESLEPRLLLSGLDGSDLSNPLKTPPDGVAGAAGSACGGPPTVSHCAVTGDAQYGVYGTIWEDANCDGAREQGEPGLEGWTVFADANGNGQLDDGEISALTSGDGQYVLPGLPVGTYAIIQQCPDGWAQTYPREGATQIADVTSETEVIAGVDYGNARYGQIGGQVWNDINADGFQGGTEPALQGWTVYIDANNNGQLDEGETTATTGEYGSYEFQNLLPGDYVVREQVPPDDGWIDPGAQTVSVSIGGWADAGFRNVQAGLHGRVWQDWNGDGAYDDLGLRGWTVYADTNGNGLLDQGEPSTTTSMDGYFSLFLQDSGTYTLREQPRDGWAQTAPAGGDFSYTADYQPLEVLTGFDFGNFLAASIQGSKFNDLNGNGQWDEGEPAMSGWTIYLDLNADGQLDEGEPSTVTDSNGSYTFSGLETSYYLVAEVNRPDWVQSAGDYWIWVGNEPGYGGASGADFGNYLGASISGREFLDANGDGEHDPGEVGLDGLQIQLLDANWNCLRSVTTYSQDLNGDGVIDPETESGLYTVTGIPTGTYKVQGFYQPGWTQTIPTNPDYYQVSLAAGDNLTGLDFGNQLVLSDITGMEWNDLNGNGVVDEGEPGVPDMTVYLYQETGDGEQSATTMSSSGGDTVLVGTTTTDANGQYSFSGVLPGEYFVHFDKPPATMFALMHAGSDPALDSDVYQWGDTDRFMLPQLEPEGDTINAGLTQAAEISGSVWNDANGNGLWDEGEPAMSGRTVYVGNDQGTQDAYTDDNGHYVMDLTPGSYQVWQELPYAMMQTYPTYATTGYRSGYAVDLAVGQTVDNLDFALAPSGSVYVYPYTYYSGPELSVQVYADLNNNGLLDTGEPFVDATPGQYTEFRLLEPGTYTIRAQASDPYWVTTDVSNVDLEYPGD